MTDDRKAKVFLDLRLGDQDLVEGEARQASPREVIGAALKRLADLRARRQDIQAGAERNRRVQGRPVTQTQPNAVASGDAWRNTS